VEGGRILYSGRRGGGMEGRDCHWEKRHPDQPPPRGGKDISGQSSENIVNGGQRRGGGRKGGEIRATKW